MNGPDIIFFFLKQLVMYLLLQIVMFMLPFLQKIVNVLWFPFRALHVFLHVQSAKEIYHELEEKHDNEEDLDRLYDAGRIRSSLATGLGRPDENSMMVASFNRIEYAKRVALAPSRFGWVMLVGYLLIAPLALMNNTFTTVAGALLHFYFFVGIFGVMMPSVSDWYFVIHTIMLNLNLRPIYLFNAVLVHVIFTLDSFWRKQDFFLAVIMGTVMFLLYLVGLFGATLVAQRGKLRLSDIFVVPLRPKKELTPTVSDVEFFDMDEYED
ncbi:MAG: hypothetical protein JSW11_07995 [Candidatus Heimdallarchaeota archaeon]|nr:MAG: hypothetical protein JSW11_07995 [Candidatus Heimdallarchaeota archaeon]